jgi:hypothetical protein
MFATCIARDGSNEFKGTPKELYLVLITYSDTQGRDTEKGYPYRTRLAKDLGVSVKTVDRATTRLEELGIATVTRRKLDGNPMENDANLYELHDGWLIHGMEPDETVPLQMVARYGHQIPGFDVAAYLEARGGGDTSVSTPGDTSVSTGGDTGVSLSKAGVPQPSSPDDGAPAGRSPGGCRRPSTGSRGAEDASGSAASGNDSPAPGSEEGTRSSKKGSSGTKLTKEQRQVRNEVLSLLPPDLREAIGNIIPTNIGQSIVAALAADDARSRTPQQLVEYRLMPRWNGFWAQKFYAGELTPELGGGKRKRPFGPLLHMLADTAECGNLWCEDRYDFVTGGACKQCEMRQTDQKADRERKRRGEAPTADEANPPSADAGDASAAAVPAQRESMVLHTSVPRRECANDECALPLPKDWEDVLCGRCRRRTDDESETHRQDHHTTRAEAKKPECLSAGPAPF